MTSSTNLFTAKQLQDAYLEGFCDGEAHGNLTYKCPPLPIAFISSDTRELLELVSPIPEAHKEKVQEWIGMKYTERGEMELQFDDVKAVPVESAVRVVTSRDAIDGRWYEYKGSQVLCCGTSDPDEWVKAFATRTESGRTVLKFLDDKLELRETDKQSW